MLIDTFLLIRSFSEGNFFYKDVALLLLSIFINLWRDSFDFCKIFSWAVPQCIALKNAKRDLSWEGYDEVVDIMSLIICPSLIECLWRFTLGATLIKTIQFFVFDGIWGVVSFIIINAFVWAVDPESSCWKYTEGSMGMLVLLAAVTLT